MFSTVFNWRSASDCPLTAVIAIGTDWRLSLRKRAVTTTSSPVSAEALPA
ncbi:hypothetical protein QP185_16015 [Sphingomonas aerolata]